MDLPAAFDLRTETLQRASAPEYSCPLSPERLPDRGRRPAPAARQLLQTVHRCRRDIHSTRSAGISARPGWRTKQPGLVAEADLSSTDQAPQRSFRYRRIPPTRWSSILPLPQAQTQNADSVPRVSSRAPFSCHDSSILFCFPAQRRLGPSAAGRRPACPTGRLHQPLHPLSRLLQQRHLLRLYDHPVCSQPVVVHTRGKPVCMQTRFVGSGFPLIVDER